MPLPTDVNKMLEETGSQDDPVLEMAVVLASIAGLRRGELVGLQWQDH